MQSAHLYVYRYIVAHKACSMGCRSCPGAVLANIMKTASNCVWSLAVGCKLMPPCQRNNGFVESLNAPINE